MKGSGGGGVAGGPGGRGGGVGVFLALRRFREPKSRLACATRDAALPGLASNLSGGFAGSPGAGDALDMAVL